MRRMSENRRPGAAPTQIRTDMAAQPRLTRHRLKPWRRCSLARDHHARQHEQGRLCQLKPSLFTSPTLRGCRVNFFNGSNFICSACEQSDEAINRSGRSGCFKHTPAIWQQIQFDFFPGLMPRCCSASFLNVTCPRAVTVNIII